jgi:cytochrome c biogenesis factor
MINIPFGMHMALHVHVATLFMAYVFFKICLTLAMAYILVRMHIHAPFETQAMA